MSDAPSWLNDDVPPAASSSSGGGGGGGSSNSSNGLSSASSGDNGGEEDGPRYKTTAQMVLAFINIGMCVFMSATGVLGIMGAVAQNEGEDATDAANEVAMTDVFVGTYMILFSLILFCYEIAYVSKVEAFNKVMKRNVGFLYGMLGKSFFTVFIAVLVFGLSQPQPLVLSCGITIACWGPIQLLYYMRFPDHFDKVEKYDPRQDGIAL